LKSSLASVAPAAACNGCKRASVVESITCLVSLLLRLLGGFFCSYADRFFGRLSDFFTLVNGRGESLSNFEVNLYKESQ
jgi:hypothetical protein